MADDQDSVTRMYYRHLLERLSLISLEQLSLLADNGMSAFAFVYRIR